MPSVCPEMDESIQVWEVWNKGAYRLQSDPKYVGKKTMVILRNPVNRNQMKTYMERE